MSPRDWCIGRTAIVRILVRAAAALALLALLGPAAARGDDRDLLRTTIADPYLFILLDTSGSMNWSPKGRHLPDRRLLRAPAGRRRGLQVLPGQAGALRGADRPRPAQGGAGLRDLQPGPARHRRQKHWLYEAKGNGVLLTGSTYFPAAGVAEVFGNALGLRHRQQRQRDRLLRRVAGRSRRRLGAHPRAAPPQGGPDLRHGSQTFFIRTAGITYKVTYTPNGGCLRRQHHRQGHRPQVQQRRLLEHHVASARRPSTSRRSATSSPGTTRTPTTRTAAIRRITYYTSVAVDTVANNSCAGWDPNTDTASDKNAERLQPALADRQLGPAGSLVHPRRRHPAGLEDGPQGRHPEAAGAELRRQLARSPTSASRPI